MCRFTPLRWMTVGMLVLVSASQAWAQNGKAGSPKAAGDFPQSVEVPADLIAKAKKVGFVDLVCHEIRLSPFGPRQLGTTLEIDYNLKQGLMDPQDGTTSYGISGTGAIFPLGPHLYRVVDIKHFGKPPRTPEQARQGVVRLEQVVEEWAAELTPKADSFVIPIPGYGGLHSRHVMVTEIFQEQNSPRDIQDVVKLELRGGKVAPVPVLVLKTGETFDLENVQTGASWRHTVRKIVPKGVREGVVGWVEFDLQGTKIKEPTKADPRR